MEKELNDLNEHTYYKYGGHCSLCGSRIAKKDMFIYRNENNEFYPVCKDCSKLIGNDTNKETGENIKKNILTCYDKLSDNEYFNIAKRYHFLNIVADNKLSLYYERMNKIRHENFIQIRSLRYEKLAESELYNYCSDKNFNDFCEKIEKLISYIGGDDIEASWGFDFMIENNRIVYKGTVLDNKYGNSKTECYHIIISSNFTVSLPNHTRISIYHVNNEQELKKDENIELNEFTIQKFIYDYISEYDEMINKKKENTINIHISQ